MRSKHVEKTQSAMEYLMTYGWAILLIAVIFIALFELGVFDFLPLPIACLPNPSFLCSNESFSSGGSFTETFGYIGTEPITITGLACNVTLAAPPKTPSFESAHILIEPGQKVQLTFQCPTSSQMRIGTSIPLSLWFYYNTSSESGLEDKYAQGWATVNYQSFLWNVTEWTPSSSNVQLLPYNTISANPASPSGISVVNTTQWSSINSNLGNGWAFGTDWHNHDVYFGMETTLFPIPPLNLDNAPCSGPPYSSHAYTAISYMHFNGTYNITIVSDDATEVFYKQIGSNTWTSVFNGNAWKGQPPTEYTQNVVFSNGNYEVAVDYMDTCDPAGVSVFVISPAALAVQ